jgi:hypothetical protein
LKERLTDKHRLGMLVAEKASFYLLFIVSTTFIKTKMKNNEPKNNTLVIPKGLHAYEKVEQL